MSHFCSFCDETDGQTEQTNQELKTYLHIFCTNNPVTVEEPPIPFSPFSSADCTMLSHFSFNNFVAIAFPDLAGDLDIQI